MVVHELRARPVVQATTQRGRVEEVLRTMFDRTCEAIERIDGRRFDEFVWSRDHNGGWLAGDEGEGVYTDRALLEGNVFEKVGVNYAALEVVLPPGMSFRGADVVPQSTPSAPAAAGEPQRFYAVSTSFVMHPRNPMVPTAHVNYRYFETGDGSEPGSWWFGGGGDLTPAYLFEEDAVHFHKVHKEVCDHYDPSYYPRFKKWCDEYFYLPHRGECRGVGGIFFDYLKDRSWEELFAFVRECSEAFVPAYLPIVERRKDTPYTDEQKYWHRLHRGRYVEFIVGIDRGTRFGLQTGLVRPHSVLNCMPAAANWQYDDEPAPGSQEAALRSTLRSPRNWV